MKEGKLIIFSAPSGSGKSTIINALRERGLEFEFSVSATSRAPRGTERNGVEYHFLSPDEFRKIIAEGGFIEYEEVYKDQFYGTLKREVDGRLSQGRNVIFDIDVKGALNIKRIYADKALTVFIQPPGIEELSRRLHGRGTESEELIQKRLAKAEYEMSFAGQFDEIIINDDLEEAINRTERLVRDFLS